MRERSTTIAILTGKPEGEAEKLVGDAVLGGRGVIVGAGGGEGRRGLGSMGGGGVGSNRGNGRDKGMGFELSWMLTLERLSRGDHL